MILNFKPLGVITILLILLPVSLIIAPVFFLINLISRTVVWALAKCLRPDLESFVLGERGMLMTGTAEKDVLNISVVVVFNGEVTVEYGRKCVQERIMEARDPQTGKRLYETLEKTLEGFMGYGFWRKDPNFDLKDHVRDYDYGGDLKLDNPCTEQELESTLGGLLKAPWVKDRSPWEILLVHNMFGKDGKKRTGFIIRINHTLGDGFSIMNFGRVVTGSEFSVPKFKLAEKKFSILEKIVMNLKAPYDFLSMTLDTLGSEQLKWTEFSKDTHLALSMSPVIKVEDIKSIRRKYDVSYAAVTYAAVFGGFSRVLKATGQEGPAKLATAVILPSIGHPHKGMEVYTTCLPAKFTLKAKSSLDRLLAIDLELGALSKSAAFLFPPVLSRYLAYFPMFVRKFFLEQLITQMGISTGISCFPVTTSVEHFDGIEFESIYFNMGNWANSGMFITAGGANNKQIFNVSINSSVFKSPKATDILGQCIQDEIQMLLTGAVITDKEQAV